MWALCAAALALYLVAAFQLEPIVRWLWPIPVAMFVVYPYLKRVTWLCHLWLGACTGLAPLGAWLAVTGHGAVGGVGALRRAGSLGRRLRPLLLALRSRPRPRRGAALVGDAVRGARRVHRRARSSTSPPSLLLAAVGVGLGSDVFYWLGVVAVAGLLVYEHTLVRPGDLRRLDAAFFTVNGVISVVFFVFVVLATTV